MELVTALLSSLLFIGSPAGAVLDQVAESAIRSRLANVEQLDVRVDNASALQLLRGEVERVRVGARGVYPVPDLRIALAELETDPIDLDVAALQRGQVILERPLQGAIHVEVTPEDLNRFLQSPLVTERLKNIRINMGNASQMRDAQRYQLSNPKAEFLPNNRLKAELDLADSVQGVTLKIEAETGFTIENGHLLRLIEPRVFVDGNEAPPQIVETFAENLGDQLSLRQLEDDGVTLRVLDLNIDPATLDLAFWVQIDPRFTQR
jgi:LmeA-like phospholipid-binding